MKNIFIIALMVIVTISATAQERRIDWMHGLGGNTTSWDTTAQQYNTQRRVTAFTNGTYETGLGVPEMADRIATNTPITANAIGIGHSMGGVAARHLDILNPNRWGGIITLGSPLGGARIVNAVRDGEAQALINNGVDKMMKGPRAGSVAVTSIPPGIGLYFALASVFSNKIAEKVVKTIVNKLSLSVTTTAHLSPEGTYTQGMISQTTNTPKIQIWGNESDPLLWRLAGTFGFGGDEQGVTLMNSIAGVYGYHADVEASFSWLMWPLGNFHSWRSGQWREGQDWVLYTSNDAWAQLIGAAYSQTFSGSTPKMICDYNYYYGTCNSFPNPDACRASCWGWEYYSYTHYIKTESDGVVPASSQRNDGGAWKDVTLRAIGNINHQEHLRWDRIQPTLNMVFSQNYDGANQVFQIDLR
jgi:pimeloyl-ACP methyl ester carboxylesterase